MLLIIKPQALSAVQQLSSHPGLALFNNINTVRLSPPNNSELWIPPPSWATTLITPVCKDVETKKQALLPPPSSHHHGTGICSFQTHQHTWVTTAMIFSNLVLITWMYDTCYKMSDNYSYRYFCRVYIPAHLSAILSKLSPLSTLHKDTQQQGSSWSMVHVGSCRKEPPPSLYTPSRYS